MCVRNPPLAKWLLRSALRVASYLHSVSSFWPSRSRKVTWERRVFSRAGVPPPITPPGCATRSTRARPLPSRARAELSRRAHDDKSGVIGDSFWRSRIPVGVGAACQPSIPKGEQSGLRTRIAMTESVSLCARMKS
jgi:hypothetical protein